MSCIERREVIGNGDTICRTPSEKDVDIQTSDGKSNALRETDGKDW